MCLYIKSSIRPLPRIADEDIIVYKVVSPFTENTFVTLFRQALVELRQTYDSTLSCPIPLSDGLYGITEGLHSFRRKENAFAYTKKLSFLSIKLIILECVIPKGSKYYKGMFSKYSCYASNQLKYIKYVFDG